MKHASLSLDVREKKCMPSLMTYICSPYTKKRMTADQVGSLFIAVVARDDENEEPFAKGKEMV